MAPVTREEFQHELLRFHPERPSFAGRDLAGIDLAEHLLGQIDFSRADLRGADLHGSRLDGADFSGADLRGADLRGASLRHAWLERASLADVDLQGADLSHAMLAGTDLREARLRGAWLDGVEFSGTEMPGNWESITRVHWVPDDPFARHDIVAAVRRDLADADRPGALLTLQREIGIREEFAELLLARLIAEPIDTLAGVRTDDLPPPLARALADITATPSAAATATQLAELADTEPAACRRHGLRWTLERVLQRRRTIDTVMLLRHLGLELPDAKGLVDQASMRADLILESCELVDDGLLDAGADRLASGLWGLEFDVAVRLLWGLRAGLLAM